MKLIKLIMVGLVTLTMVFAQNQQGGTQGPPQGPDPFQQAFMTTMQNGGTPDEAFEAVAAVFHQMEVECDDCEMTEEEFQEGKAEAKAAFDAVLANGGTPEEAFHAAMESGNDGPGTCDVCGYEYGGEDDHHGHCRVCDAEMNADEDWQAHCEENPDHCKAQAGDVCGFRGWDGQGEECGYVHTGDPGEDHHHCDHCGLAVNSGEEMHNHMQADHPDMMEQHEDDGGDHDGPPPFEDVDSNGDGSIDRDEARNFFGDEPNFDEEYDKVDTNGDGMVDHDEYMASDGGDHEGGDGDDGPPPFEDVDSNGDGSIDRDEARDYFGDEPNFDEEYDRIDTNGDGMVDHDEYMASDGGDHDGPMAGDTCQFMDADGVQCTYVYTGTEADQDHNHNN